MTAAQDDGQRIARMACGAPVVLRSEDFGSVAELLEARARIAGPVLFRVRPSELAAVLDRLPAADDVCLDSDPARLVEHRRQALADRTAIDPLTGLLQRTSFVRSAMAELPAALLVINLDHFKRFNDLHGHRAGDDVLRAAAIRTRATAPATARIARIGGDTFAVAVAEGHDPRQVAEAIRTGIGAAPLHPEGTVTVSIGLVSRTTESSYDELLRRAEAALYAAKARGRNRVVDHAERERVARERDGDVELDGFEDMTRVLADRVADVISSRGRRVFQELRDQADLDALTGLASRRYLDRRLPFEIDRARDTGRPLSVALLDIDHFGRVNKDHGWPSGDKVLVDTAARIRAALRGTDWSARYGGEEICIVLEDTSVEAACAALERVRTAVAAAPFMTTGAEPLAITVSIGCAGIEPGDTPALLVERASARLLVAKREGRDRVR